MANTEKTTKSEVTASDRMRLLYHGDSGDDWLLVRSHGGDVEVEHRPNGPSGGKISRISVGEFLQTGHRGPQHDALLHLLATLVEVAPAGSETS
jgi:hypothetical protein